MIRTIDRHNGLILQKITTPHGSLISFQLIPENAIGDSSQSRRFGTLSAARQAGGWVMGSISKPTKPKTAYIQNQKGYRADNRR